MSKVRIVYKIDKTVAVIYPAPKSKREDETEKQWLKRVFTKAMQGDLKGLSYDDIDSSELPQSREERDAWTGKKGLGVSIDSVKAQLIRDKKRHLELIAVKQREMAINELKMERKLPQDYKEV